MKYFVTGGAGFIGSHLVDKLILSGEVTVYDNLSSGRKDFISRHVDNSNFSLIEDDLLNFERLSQSIHGADTVFHLAANPEARRGMENTSLDLEQETLATYNLLEAMRKNGVKKLVFASSGTIYGETGEMPVREDFGPCLPISLYGAGKLACEGLISGFCGTFGMQAWIFRFANVVGKRATHGVIYDFIHKLLKNPTRLEILGDGRQSKPYLHVSDCLEGILFGCKNSREQVNLYNLGTSDSTDVTTIAKLVTQAMDLENVKFSYSGGKRGWPGDVPTSRFDVDKISKLGWKPEMNSLAAVGQAVQEVLAESVTREEICKP